MKRILGLMLLAATAGALMLTAACGDPKPGNNGGGANPPAETPMTKLVWTGIPDGSADDLKEQGKLICDYLNKSLGIPVEFYKVDDYKAAVDALLSKKVDMVWFGGNTSVEAEERSKGEVEFVACRDIDLKFRSHFIANAAVAAKLGKINSLADLKAKAKELKLVFGSDKSTSGHLMPRHFMMEAGFPKSDGEFKAAFANVAYSGNHANTLTQVADGTGDIGALNYSYYDKAAQDLRDKAPIIYSTPEYVDYVFVARKDLGAGNIDKIRKAMIAVDKTKNADLLKAWGNAGGYVTADAAKWEGIRRVREGLGWKQ